MYDINQAALLQVPHAIRKSTDAGQYYRIALDARDLNYAPFVDEGNPDVRHCSDYTSDSTERLDVEATKGLLLRLPEIIDELRAAGRQ